MRKMILGLVAVLALTVSTTAQTKMLPVADTSVNATTRNISTPLIISNSGDFAFQYVGTKLSGTVAGVVRLFGAVDGVNFVRIGTDSLSLADVSVNTKIFDVAATPRTVYRFQVTTTGTVSLKNAGYYISRK